MRVLVLLGVALAIVLGLAAIGFEKFQEQQVIELVQQSTAIGWPEASEPVRFERTGDDVVAVVILPEGSIDEFLAAHPELTVEKCPWGGGTRPKWRCGSGVNRVGDVAVTWSVSLDLSKRKLTESVHGGH